MWKPQTKEAVLREVRIREWRKQVGKTVVVTLKWLFEIFLKGTIAASMWLKWQLAKVACDLEESRLLSQRYDRLFRLGETVYAMYRAGEVSWQVIEPLCQELKEIDQKLDAAKVSLLQVLPCETKSEQTLKWSASSSQ